MFLCNLKIILLLFVSAFFLISCSSSSYLDRYKPSNIVKGDPKKQNIPSEYENLKKEDVSYDQNKLIEKLNSFAYPSSKKQKLIDEIIKYLGTPYQYGGNSKSGIDCSAFIQQVFENSLSINLPRTTIELYEIGKRIEIISDLKFGDLIYFDTIKNSFPGHVGIYLGEDLFAHASVSQGVTISSLMDEYFKNKFVGASRLTQKKQ